LHDLPRAHMLVSRSRGFFWGNKTMGIKIFQSVKEALRAGFMIDSPIPDANGFLRAHIHTRAGWAEALVVPDGELL
jgi:hypothetical protein